MEEFWKTDIGKILSHGIHEHNSGIGLLRSNLMFIKDLIDTNKIELNGKQEHIDYFKEVLDRFDGNIKRCLDSVDYIYEKIKGLENGSHEHNTEK